MGSDRQGFNLFHKYGRRVVWSELRRGRWQVVREYVFRDTLTRGICWLSGGHEFYWQPDPVNEPEEVFCNWCHKRKPTPPPKEEKANGNDRRIRRTAASITRVRSARRS